MTARRHGRMPAALGVALLLAACGGGGGGNTTASTTTTPGGSPAPQTASMGVTVIDGPIQGAVVCLDKNGNGLCDAGEPTGTTDANGKATLTIDPADQGKYPVVAVIGTDAVDKDTGKVTQPFTLMAPADQAGVVSPITTLVQATIQNTGASTGSAAAAVQSQLGISASSLFVDYTQDSSTGARQLARVAQVVVATTQQQVQALQGAVNTTALDGGAITQQDIQKAVAQAVLQTLSQVVKAALDPANQGQSSSQVAQGLVSGSTLGLNAGNVGGTVAAGRAPDTTADAPTAGGNLMALNYTDANDWSRRLLTLSQAQATPDAGNNVRYYDRRARADTGTVANWSFSGDPTRQNDVHWNGSAWVQCKLLQESTATVRDAQGRSGYNYCDNFEVGGSVRHTIDLGKRPMASLYQQLQSSGYTNVTIANASAALGSGAFPDGSRLFLQVTTPLSNALAYIPNIGQQLRIDSAGVAGGDATACGKITSATPFATYTTLATKLDAVIAANAGTPCVYQASTQTGPRNEWWSQSTLSIGILGRAPTGGTQASYYTTNTPLRVAFGANSAATYYACQQRASDGSIRNCNAIGTGTYTITAVGNARVLMLQNQPAQFAGLSYQRIFVERNGLVYFGYQNRPTVVNSARLNLTASNALFTQLGMPVVDPEVKPALTTASYQGDWIVSNQQPQVTTGNTIHIPGNGGAPSCFSNDSAQSVSCTLTLDPASGSITYSATDGAATGTFGFDSGAASGTFTPTGGAATPFTGGRR